MRQRVPLLLAATALSALALRAVAGHDAMAGRTLFSFSATHGIDVGDIPVMVIWLVGMLALAWLWVRR